jgi:hypothetical protein
VTPVSLQHDGQCQQYDTNTPLGNATAFVDPVIVPDPANPDAPLTSTSGPNPHPDDPLIPSDVLASMDPAELSTLAQVGVTSSPPPATDASIWRQVPVG